MLSRKLLALLMLVPVVSGCALSRQGQLERKSERIESHLKGEQARVLKMSADDGERGARLDHLTQLRWTLSAANIGLAAVPRVVAEPQRDLAYDVLEEAYDTIDWNIPLGPGDTKRALPSRFSGGVLKLD